MSLRDDLLPVFDDVRSTIQDLGLRRFAVTLRRRVWDGPQAGDGNVTVQDIALTPPPRVRVLVATDRQMIDILVTGSYASTRLYRIDKITPRFTRSDGSTGGYTPQQLRLRVNAETSNLDPIVVLVGDDGFARECVQVLLSDDRAFGYSMVVQETDRKAVAITSISVALSASTLARPATVQATALGTFEDGSTSDVTPLVAWVVQDGSIAAVDSLGVVTGKAVGTTNVFATFRGFQSALAQIQVTS